MSNVIYFPIRKTTEHTDEEEVPDINYLRWLKKTNPGKYSHAMATASPELVAQVEMIK